MNLLDSKLLSCKLKDEIKADADSYRHTPILCIISENNNNEYINNVRSFCEYVGISLLNIKFEKGTLEKKIINKIKSLNKDDNINGIIVLSENSNLVNYIKPIKNASLNSDLDGIIELLNYYKVDVSEKHVVIIGDNKLLFKDLLIEFLSRKASVSIINNKDIKKIINISDILIVEDKKDISDYCKKDTIVIDLKDNIDMSIGIILKNLMNAYKEQNKDKKEE